MGDLGLILLLRPIFDDIAADDKDFFGWVGIGPDRWEDQVIQYTMALAGNSANANVRKLLGPFSYSEVNITIHLELTLYMIGTIASRG